MQFQRKYFMLRHCLARFRTLVSCGTFGRCSRNPRVPRNPGWKSLTYTYVRPQQLRRYAVLLNVVSVLSFQEWMEMPSEAEPKIVGHTYGIEGWVRSDGRTGSKTVGPYWWNQKVQNSVTNEKAKTNFFPRWFVNWANSHISRRRKLVV